MNGAQRRKARRLQIDDGLWTPYRLMYGDRETASQAGAFDWGDWRSEQALVAA